MNAAEVCAALSAHWKPSEYLVLEECPQDSMRQGRKIDVLVVSLWKSRGHELDAIEIKVSLSDWMREVNEPAKADWWFEHTHRFSVAVPSELAAKVKETLPSGWGLLAVGSDGKVGTIVKATKHDAAELPWTAVVGIMRAASGAGANALLREHERGRKVGVKQAESTARMSGSDHDRRQFESLQAKVKAFEDASGLSIHGQFSDVNARQLGELVALVQGWQRNPAHAADALRHNAKALRGHADGLATLADALLPTTELGAATT